LKHFLRIFSIFLAITFSLNASKSYGQVVLSIDKTIICPGDNILLSVINNNDPYPYALIQFSTDNTNFTNLFTPGINHELVLQSYDGTQTSVFNYPTTESNTTTTIRKVYYRVAFWPTVVDGSPTGTVAYSNTVSIDVRPAANVKFGFVNSNQVVCLNSSALSIAPKTPVGTLFSWFKLGPTDLVYVAIAGQQNNATPTLPANEIITNVPGITFYRVVATYGVECLSDMASTKVTVDPTSVAGTVSIASGTASICANTTAPTLTLTGNTGSILNWSSSGTISGTYNSLGGSITPTISNTQTAYYIATVKSGVCPSINTAPILVTVNQASNAGTISPVTQSICYNATPAAITLTGYLGTIQWQSSLTSSAGPAGWRPPWLC
jgi:hypothetical protein